MSRKVVIVGGGIIGLFAAYNAVLEGFDVTVLERGSAHRDGCSFGNAGMVVPSHFIPLASPGMVKLGLKWMWNPKSPFYIKPRFSWDLLAWGYHFWRSATKRHVELCAPILRDLNLAIYRDHPDVQTIAEESTAWPLVSHPLYLGGLGFGMKWMILCR